LADLGAVGDDDLATLHASGQLVLLSRAAGVGPPSDTVFTDVSDDSGLERTARRARSLGFFGKAVIHPRQIEPVHRVFTPTEIEITHARAVLEAAARADADGDGAVALDGKMIDEPIVHRARAILTLADSIS
jgi:citrate lyase subunit beta/citryl-CoA lyase